FASGPPRGTSEADARLLQLRFETAWALLPCRQLYRNSRFYSRPSNFANDSVPIFIDYSATSQAMLSRTSQYKTPSTLLGTHLNDFVHWISEWVISVRQQR